MNQPTQLAPNTTSVMPSQPSVMLRQPSVMLSLSKHALAIGICATLLAGCAMKNKNEKEADKITQAVIANNMSGVINDFDSQAKPTVTRIAVARLSDELNQQGKYQGVTEVQNANAGPGGHVFDVKFEKHTYTETMVLDDDGKVRSWKIHMKDAVPKP